MASNIFHRTTVDGKTTTYSRKGTQGRKPSGLPLVTKKIIWNVTESQKQEFSEFARQHGMSESKMIDILVFLGKQKFLNQ